MFAPFQTSSSYAWRDRALLFLTIALTALLAGCSEELAGPEFSDSELSLAKGRPVQCNAGTNLSITLADGGALQSDGGGAYVEGVDDVGAHINDPTGRLMFFGSPSRPVIVTSTAGTFATTDRIYTNNHDNDDDGSEDACGLDGTVGAGLQPGGSGFAVLEAELDVDGIVRYGKDCSAAIVPGSRVITSRSADGDSWTISGTSGVHCRHNGLKGKNSAFVQVGTAGPFSMTLVAIGS